MADRRAAATTAPSEEPAAPRDRLNVAGRREEIMTIYALLDMTIGTGDEELKRIRAEHAVCEAPDCPHLTAFNRGADRHEAQGQMWRDVPEPRHQRPRRGV